MGDMRQPTTPELPPNAVMHIMKNILVMISVFFSFLEVFRHQPPCVTINSETLFGLLSLLHLNAHLFDLLL